ncbi:MAG: hypothetical protein J6L01_01910 [Alistipes sp.]|nr:hypothetical protein [Alistipes sp.]
MKKYFIAALALVALVACSKNEDGAPVFDDSKKSVQITVGNLASATRAAGGITPAATDNALACADASDVIVLFADSPGNVIVSKKLSEATVATDGSFIFHAIPENVVMVAAIANVAQAPATLTAANAAWQDEAAMLAAPYRNIVDNSNPEAPTTTYGVVAYSGPAFLENNGKTCTVDGDHTEYPLLEADELFIAPYMARIEINHLACTDLGQTANKGYDRIGFTSLSLAGQAGNTNAPYTHTLSEFESEGSFLAAEYQVTAPHIHGATGEANKVNYAAPAEGVWSWNIVPQDVSNLTVGLYVVGNGYQVQIPEKTVTVDSYNKGTTPVTEFESGNIYRFSIDFAEENVDSDTQFVCANVDVKIAQWVVNDLTVDFVTPAP